MTISVVRSLRFVFAHLSAAPLALIAGAAPASLEDRVRALETQSSRISQENGDLKKQLGAMVSGSVLDKKLSYAAGLFNGSGINYLLGDPAGA